MISNEILRECRKVNAINFLESAYGIDFVKAGANTYKMLHDKSVVFFDASCNRDGCWRFKDFSVTKSCSGDIIDFCTVYLGAKWIDVLNNISSYIGISLNSDKTISYTKSIKNSEKTITKEKIKKAFELPKRNTGSRNNARVFAYLLNRGIDKEIIYHCFQKKILYQDTKNNCVFVGLEIGKKARYAFLRGTCNLPNIPQFRGEVESSSKKFGFSLSPESKKSQLVIVCESPIDVLSYATILNKSGKNWKNYHYLSLGGVSDLGLEQFLKDHPEILKVHLTLDNDLKGQKATAEIIERYKNHKVEIIANNFSKKYKDVNEYLLKFLEKNQKKELER